MSGGIRNIVCWTRINASRTIEKSLISSTGSTSRTVCRNLRAHRALNIAQNTERSCSCLTILSQAVCGASGPTEFVASAADRTRCGSASADCAGHIAESAVGARNVAVAGTRVVAVEAEPVESAVAGVALG